MQSLHIAVSNTFKSSESPLHDLHAVFIQCALAFKYHWSLKDMHRVSTMTAPLCDVDEVLLKKANKLRCVVQKERGSIPTITSVEDIPKLLIFVFEVISGSALPDDEKQPQRLRISLQMILDTIQGVMRLPFSHVTGNGLISHDRRQLDDALDIFMKVAETYSPRLRKGDCDEQQLSINDLSLTKRKTVDKSSDDSQSLSARQASIASSRRSFRASVISTKVRRHSSVDGSPKSDTTRFLPGVSGRLLESLTTNLDKLVNRLEHLRRKKREIELEEAKINQELDELIHKCRLARG